MGVYYRVGKGAIWASRGLKDGGSVSEVFNV